MKKAKFDLGICVTSDAALKSDIKLADEFIANNSTLKISIENKLNRTLGNSQSASQRISSMQSAFNQSQIVIAWDGGFNSIELLPKLDSIMPDPNSVFVGYSDNTLLVNALAVKYGLSTWYGPNFLTILKRPKMQYSLQNFLLAILKNETDFVFQAFSQSDLKIHQSGLMTGKIWGGNNYTFDLLQGTEFCPNFNEPFILFLEGETLLENKKEIWPDFVRNIDSILLQTGAKDNIQGLIIGKFPNKYKIAEQDLYSLVKTRPYLKNKPVIFDFPCGHSEDSLYLPIGRKVSIKATPLKLTFKLY